MAVPIVIISLAFLWLIYETYLLGIRLPTGKIKTQDSDFTINTIVGSLIGMLLFPIVKDAIDLKCNKPFIIPIIIPFLWLHTSLSRFYCWWQQVKSNWGTKCL